MNAPKIGPVYLVTEGQMLLAAPLDKVWQLLLDYPSWQNFPVVKHISGPIGGEGEVVLLRKEEKGFTFPPYYAITIKKEPKRRLIWKTYPERGSEKVDFFGIVDFRIDEVQGQTRFSNSLLYEFQVPYVDESELQEFHKQQSENFAALSAVIFPKLKKLAEQGA